MAAGEDAAVASGISTGDYFLIAIAEPTVDHAVNADPTTVAYAVPAAAITHTPRTLVAYAVDADPVTVAYAVPQPGVTHQGRTAVDHTVNAGAVTVAYAVPQPSVSHTVVVFSHAVDAGAVTVAYAVPQPTVTIHHAVDADPVAVTYAVPAAAVKHTQVVDADPVAVTYAVPAAAVTHTAAAPLTLADWDDTGLVPDFAALIEVSGTTQLYADSDRGGTDTPIDGDLRIDDATDISRVQWNDPQFIWNDNDNPNATNLENYYQPGGAGNDQTIYLVAGTAAAHTTESFDVATYYPGDSQAGGNNIRWGAGTALPAAVTALLDGLAVGDRLILASARPVAQGTANADPVTVTYAVPQPTVKHTHRVDADPVSVAFAVPQPSVTHTVRTFDHAVDAGSVAVVYAVPAATVTHTTVVGTNYTRNAGAVSVAYAVPAAAVKHTHAVDADPVSVAYAVPAAAVTHTLPDTHAVSADPVSVAYAVPAAAVTHTLPNTHAVDADAVAVAYAVPAAAVTSSAPVTLADWDDTGLVDDFAAVDPGEWQSDPVRQRRPRRHRQPARWRPTHQRHDRPQPHPVGRLAVQLERQRRSGHDQPSGLLWTGRRR